MQKWIIAVLLLAAILLAETFAMQDALPILIVLLVIVLLIVVELEVVPPMLEKRMNKVLNPPPYPVSPETTVLHEKLTTVDLHADPLLWRRDLLKKSSRGHVDVPRMLEGNLAFQVFGIVTKSPKGQNFQSNTGNAPDNITLLAVLQGWPLSTWRSLYQRALYQVQKLDTFSRHSNGQLMLVRSIPELDQFLAARAAGRRVVGGVAMLEGVHALEGRLEYLDSLYAAGLRVVGLTHFFDNEAAGSAHGATKGGLTPFGRQVVQRAQELHMVVDLAHSSAQVIDEVLAMTKVPVIASHTGVCGTHQSPRNLSDEHIRGIAATGGVLGIAMFDEAVGETSVEATARAIRYVTDLVGVEYAAVGCDMDGTIIAPIDVSGLPRLTEALMKQGFSEDEIRKIMGENALRVFRALLPAE